MIVKKSEIPVLKNKYISKIEFCDLGYPVIPNELIDGMEYLKSDSNESGFGIKIIIFLLQFRNISALAFQIKDISGYIGYSKKQSEKGLTWLVKKGLMIETRGRCNARKFRINYVNLSYTEIMKDIHEQIENDIPPDEVVFKGVRFLTTREFKKEGDGKFIDNFTFIHPGFIPSAILTNGEYKLYSSLFFNQADGNTIKIILKLYRLTSIQMENRNHPELKIKIDTIHKKCGISRNKTLAIIQELIAKKYLRVKKNDGNARSLFFNFKEYRTRVVALKRNSQRAKQREVKNQRQNIFSLPVLGFLEPVSCPVSEPVVLPSWDSYNKQSILKETFNNTKVNITEKVFVLEKVGQEEKKEEMKKTNNSYDYYKN